MDRRRFVRAMARTFVLVGFFTIVAMPQAISAAEAAGPRVPSFARFHEQEHDDPAAGGRLLIGELNCVACHAAGSPINNWIDAKPAPVLSQVAARVRPEYLRRYLASPHEVDPGTTMPDLFVGVPGDIRDAQVEALVHFLAADDTVVELRSDAAAARRGEALFHSIGCAVCHGDRRDDAAPLPTNVTLNVPGEKYSIRSLADFLRKPHDVRRGGRMPDMGLDEKQSLDIAHYLIPDANPKPKDPRLTYRVYHGTFNNLPDFSTLTPVAEGQSDGFDVHVAGRTQNFAVVYEGFLKIDQPEEYWFLLASDDGSKLFIDGELVSNNDGIHANMTVRGARRLEAGVHPIRVEYAQVAGEQKLSLQFEAPGLPRQRAENAIYLTAEAVRARPQQAESSETDEAFHLDPMLAAKGRELFASLGCANCHEKRDGTESIASTLSGPPLTKLLNNMRLAGGCLSQTPGSDCVDYRLTTTQRDAVVAALEHFAGSSDADSGQPTDAQRLDATFERFNCYACHERGGKGGPETATNGLFATSVPEMGDEGRIPPPLNGVGDKLNVDWMKHLLANGSTDRKYMRTRMPNFGGDNVARVADLLATLDQRTEVTYPDLDLPKHRIASVGRQLVGESALSCVKCHDFGPYSGTGIQAIDLQTMTRRLRRDWFVRYMLDPQKYRPGTRMPSSFRSNNASAVRDVLDGKSDQQLVAIWSFLELGSKAPIPDGTVHSAIVLTPKDRPILYRAFLEGVSPRGIAVGYPERANLAFDADEMRLALIWHNDFIDASKHWVGRGDGFQRPSGDHVLSLAPGVPLAVLSDDTADWPTATAKEQGWQFAGYRLDKQGRPTFRYGTDAFTIEDTPTAVDGRVVDKPDAVLRRTLVIKPATASLPDRLYARISAGKTITSQGDNSYRVDDALTLRHITKRGESQAIIRDVEAGQELLVPVPPASGPVRIEWEYAW